MTRPPRYKLPKYVQGFVEHGRAYHYFRRRGARRVRLPGMPWSPEFMAAYEKALARSQPRAALSNKRGSVAEALADFKKGIAVADRQTWNTHFDEHLVRRQVGRERRPEELFGRNRTR